MRLAYMRLRKAKLCLTVIAVTKFWSVHLNYQHISYKEIMKKLLFTLLAVTTSMTSFADEYKEKTGVDIKAIKSGLGYWETKDCKEVSDAAGLMLYLSYQSLEGADKVKKEGNKTRADELAGEGIVLAQLAADYATTFSAFCK